MAANVARIGTGIKMTPYDPEKAKNRFMVNAYKELGKLNALKRYYTKQNDTKNIKAVDDAINNLTKEMAAK
jgi:hypothetical protein